MKKQDVLVFSEAAENVLFEIYVVVVVKLDGGEGGDGHRCNYPCIVKNICGSLMNIL